MCLCPCVSMFFPLFLFQSFPFLCAPALTTMFLFRPLLLWLPWWAASVPQCPALSCGLTGLGVPPCVEHFPVSSCVLCRFLVIQRRDLSSLFFENKGCCRLLHFTDDFSSIFLSCSCFFALTFLDLTSIFFRYLNSVRIEPCGPHLLPLLVLMCKCVPNKSNKRQL